MTNMIINIFVITVGYNRLHGSLAVAIEIYTPSLRVGIFYFGDQLRQ